MPIANERELQHAMQEYNRLRDAPRESPDGHRFAALDADIRAYFLEHGGEMALGKPDHAQE